MAPTPDDPLTRDEQDLLAALARLALTLPRDFANDLGRAAGVTLSEYHVLKHLAARPTTGMRMSALADDTGLTMGAITRVMRLLEDKGLAQRHDDGADGRVRQAVITASGLERLAEAEPVQRDSARRHLFTHLTSQQIAQAASALRQVATTPPHPEAAYDH